MTDKRDYAEYWERRLTFLDCEHIGQTWFPSTEPEIQAANLIAEDAKRQKRRQHLKRSREMALASLRATEAARRSAVEAESRLGIDWNDWEDESP